MKYSLPHLGNMTTAEFKKNEKRTTYSSVFTFEVGPLHRNRIY